VQKYFALCQVQHIFALMEVNKALNNLLSSDTFKEKAKVKDKDGGKLRMFVTRYQRGEVSTGAAVTLLEKFGYKVEIFPDKPKK
jgi:hypothetical protein